jgi:hypothetical protein
MTMVYPVQILIFTHSEIESENGIIKIDNWYVVSCVCSLIASPVHPRNVVRNVYERSVSVPRVGSSEVVVVRYCSELQFSSSQ